MPVDAHQNESVCAYSWSSLVNKDRRLPVAPCALELFVGEIIFVVEVGNLCVDGRYSRARFVRRRLRDHVDWPHIALRVIAQIHHGGQTGIHQRPLKTRVRLA